MKNCDKVKFTKQKTEEILKTISHGAEQYRREKRNYYCKVCNAWHLTSKDLKEPIEKVKVVEKSRWENLLKESYAIPDIFVHPMLINIDVLPWEINLYNLTFCFIFV